MPEKDPTFYTAITYLWVLIVATMGGLVGFIRKLNRSKKPLPLRLLFIKLLGELLISAFAGVLTFYLCEYLGVNQLLTAVAIGISGHMGGNAIDLISARVEKVLKDKGEL